jgi:peptidoglycan/LPS O-acetylase OafA/YrhL
MLGLLRFILALAVIFSHLNPAVSQVSGLLAVFGFYTVSGYLICRVLRTTYRHDTGAFLLNRALRIYPAYFVAALAGLYVAARGGTPLNPAIVMPASLDDLWRQIAVFGLLQVDGTVYPVRLVPPTWSLNVELAWYLVMIVATRFVGLWLAASLAVAIYAIAAGDWPAMYFSYWGPSLCFALGAALHRYEIRLDRKHALPAFALLLALLGLGPMLGLHPAVQYTAIFAAAYVLVSADFRSARFERLDAWLGHLAYPMFLIHWHVASMTGREPGWGLLAVSLPLILLVSAAIVVLVEIPMERVRRMVRPARRGVPDATSVPA